MNDVECPVCYRIEMNGGDICQGCRWPLRPILSDKETYGCDVLVEIKTGMVGTEKKEVHYKGTEATARRRAIHIKHFSRVLAVRRWTEERYLRCYGEGRM